MRLSKKKIVVLLITVAICSSAAFAYATEANETTKPLFGNYNSSKSLGGNDSSFTRGSNSTPGLSRLFFSVLMVVVLGIAALYLSKKVLPKFTHSTGKKIQVTETVYLGPRKAIHLIKVGKQTFLIGSTNENITRLADITSERFESSLMAAEQKEKE
jgi:flagellar biosynthetic protein FliO